MQSQKEKFTQAQLALKKYFGYDNFHPTQIKAIKSIFNKKDTFVLMPTGGGKSMCYQIPALVLKGVTVVVSPLIALMKDQVDGLKAAGISAEFLNSSLSPNEQSEITENLLKGDIKILYVSAERLLSPSFTKILKKIKPNLFAVDEAHCISAWGHDFRPDYTKLSRLKTMFPKVPIIALTATADQSTRVDILSQLELDNPKQLVDSFDRPNISLTVLPGQKRIEKIKDFLKDKTTQSGIVYCLTRKQTESLAKKLQQAGFNASNYHAGLSSVERSRVQKSFIRDKTQIICATIAFGMGIDKLNVRWVIHYNLPKNIEGYYQEIGRAGRDSAPAQALLFYTYADVEMIKRFFIDKTQGDLQLAKLNRIKEYAEGVVCRRKILLNYFDENYVGKCNNCDVCANPFKTLNGTAITKKILETIDEIGSGSGSENGFGYDDWDNNQKSADNQHLKKSTSIVTTKNLVNTLSRVSDKVSFASWHFYIAQLKNLGLIKINFSKKQSLSITKIGRDVLDEDQHVFNSKSTSELKNKPKLENKSENKNSSKPKKVKLVMLDTFIKRQEKSGKTTKSYNKNKSKKDKKEYFKNPLFEKLREVRAKLAKENSLAAYMIFSDKTLIEIANEKPKNKIEMLDISGVGEIKWERYGEVFLEVVGKS